MDATAIRARIRIMLETGDLPCEDADRTWAGNGDGRRCAGCTEAIAPSEVEFEVDLASGKTIRLHRLCHAIWLEECEPVKP
jgi:hypothetical protein